VSLTKDAIIELTARPKVGTHISYHEIIKQYGSKASIPSRCSLGKVSTGGASGGRAGVGDHPRPQPSCLTP
jgi:hypothetical protein